MAFICSHQLSYGREIVLCRWCVKYVKVKQIILTWQTCINLILNVKREQVTVSSSGAFPYVYASGDHQLFE